MDNKLGLNIDEKDVRILDILQHDGYRSVTDIAKELNLAVSSISLRIKDLRQCGLIKDQYYVLDQKKLGYNITAFLTISLASLHKQVITDFIEAVNNIPQIQECYMTTGQGAFLVKIIAKDLEEYHSFVLNKLVNLPSVQNVETSIVIDVAKDTKVVPINKEDL